MAERITALFVKHTKRPGKYPDGGNLYLQVRKSTRKIEIDAVTKSWLFRYSRFGKDTWLGLGPYPDVTLSEARDLATRQRKKMRQGIDPLTDKRARIECPCQPLPSPHWRLSGDATRLTCSRVTSETATGPMRP